MKILLASGTPHLPQVRGGVEVNAHELALELIARGHEVGVLAKLSYRDMFGLRQGLLAGLRISLVTRDDDLGYPAFRAPRPLAAVSGIPRPDVVLVQNGDVLQMARAFARLGVPTVAYFQGLLFEAWPRIETASTERFPVAGCIANSEFTARCFREYHGIEATEVIPQIFRRERFATETSRENVTFINPVPEKGVDLALAIAARCPEIPFSFVKGWPLRGQQARRLRAELGRLPNVTLQDGTADMRTVYGKAKVLLVPSQWRAETWGRVATEAQMSGIPVMASRVGGLPEAVGPGGFLLEPEEPVDAWVDALKRLWHDEQLYQQRSAAALAYSRRPLIDADRVVEAFERTLRQVIDTHARG